MFPPLSLQQIVNSGRTRFAVASLLTLAVLFFVIREIEVREVKQSLQQAEPLWLILAFLSTAFHIVAKVARWQVLLGDRRYLLSFTALTRVILIGSMLNTLVPIRLGDVVRALLVGQRGVGRAYTAGTIAMEKGVDLISYGALFFCSCSSSPCQAGSTIKLAS